MGRLVVATAAAAERDRTALQAAPRMTAPIYILLVMSIGGHLEVADPIPFRGSPQLCSMSMFMEAAAYIAEHRPGATIARVKCRREQPGQPA